MAKISQENTQKQILDAITSYKSSKEFFLEIDMGHVPNFRSIHLSGRNPAVGTSLVPITGTGFYRTPTSATALEIVSSSANDTNGGSGAWTVDIHYIDAKGYEQYQTATMNGVTPVALANPCLRVLDIEVGYSGTYGTQAAGSHAGTITVRETGAGQTWAQITLASSFPLGINQKACYTIPTGHTAYILSVNHSVDSLKTVDLYFFERRNILDISAPFTPIICRHAYNGITGFNSFHHDTKEAYPENTDIGFMGVVSSGTCAVSLEIEMLLVTNPT